MSWVDGLGRSVGRRSRVLVVVRADAVEAGWLQLAQRGRAPTWATLSVPIDGAAGQTAPPAGVQSALLALQGRLADPAGGLQAGGPRRLVALVGGPWLQDVALPWAAPFLQPASARSHAQAEMAALGFAITPEDLLCIDPMPSLGLPRTVMAVPAWLHLSLQTLAAELGAKLSLQSLSAVAARWAGRQPRSRVGVGGAPAVVGVMTAGVLRLMQPDGTAPQAGHELAAPDDGGPLRMRSARLWRRARLRLPALDTSASLPVLSLDSAPAGPPAGPPGEAPADDGIDLVAWPGPQGDRSGLDQALLREALAHPTLDAAAAPRRALSLPTVAACLCGLAAAALVWSAWPHRGLPEVPTIASTGAQSTRSATPGADGAAAPVTGTELAEVRAVNAAVARINLPLAEILRTVRAPRDIAVLLQGLEVVGGVATAAARADNDEGSGGAPGIANTVKLSAEAASGSDMTRYISFLGDRQGVVAVQLVRHEIDAGHLAFPYRFVVELGWRQ